MKNPFDELDLSPLATVDEITVELRERAEDATELERKALREAWEKLTLHPRTRLELAVSTFPIGEGAEARAPAPARTPLEPYAPSLFDLLPRPSVESALDAMPSPPPPVLPPLAEDALIAPLSLAGRSRV